MAFVAPRQLEQFHTTAQLFIPSERFDKEETLEDECVVACLDCDWTPPSAPPNTEYSELTLLWFQDERDPFEALREHLARLDWEKVAAFQEF